MEESYYTAEEKKFVVDAYKNLCESFKDETSAEELKQLRQIMTNGIAKGHAARDKYGINPTVRHLNTALLITENIGADKNMVIAVLLYHLCKTEYISPEKVKEEFGDDIYSLIYGLLKVSELYKKQSALQDENFSKLMMA